MLGGMTADLTLDRIQLADPHQNFRRQRRLGGDILLVEVAAHVRPAKRQRHRLVSARLGQLLEPVVAIDLQHAAEPCEMPGRTLVLAVVRVDVGRHREASTFPGTIVHRVAPQPAGLGPPAARIENRQRGVVGENLRRGQHCGEHQVVERCQPPAGAPDPVCQRRAVQLDALAFQHLRLPGFSSFLCRK
jgi:hypothetical protein